jgi:hypothetical protein
MMEFISKLEKTILGWAKNVPHLPTVAQKWLGDNVWWIALIGAILSGIATLVSLVGLFGAIAAIGAASSIYYASSTHTSFVVVSIAFSLVFIALNGLLLAFAVKPLQEKEKKGWVLLFMTLLLEALSIIVNAVLTFSVAGFIVDILLGAIGLAIGAYLIFEIHGQFSHAPKATIKKV